MKKVELMCPAKNLKSIKSALGNADAVYFGVQVLNMRMMADNFKLEELPKIVKFCHENNIRTYLTTNVIIYEHEIEVLSQVLDHAAAANIDAVIVHDVGAIELAKEKNLDFHISTQASISNSMSAKYYENLGAKRLILARELSLEQIREIKKKLKKTEIETFVHGAQCTSISGRCYFSAEILNSPEFSANRGKCIQPCRRRWIVTDDTGKSFFYDGVYFLNTKDLCMIEYIPQLIEANIDAFKIEGRIRDPLYVEITSKCYREAIDSYYTGNFIKEKVENWIKELKKVYNRGFSTGFYFGPPQATEIERDISGNVSEFRKREIGKVLSYYRDKKAAKILLTWGQLKVGDEVIIMGINTDTYLRQKITSLQKKKKMITETNVASKENHITVGILVDSPVKENDRVYILEKYAYKNV
jgi:putative protease